MPKKIHYLEYFDVCPKCHEPFGSTICGKFDEEEEIETTTASDNITCKNCLRLLERRKNVKERRKKNKS
jgi:hypothetical protein